MTSRQRLTFAFSNEVGISPTEVESVFEFLRMPEDMRGVMNAGRNLRLICEEAKRQCFSSKIPHFDALENFADFVLNHEGVIHTLVKKRYAKKTSDMRGCCKKHPEWAMLVLTRVDGPYSRRLAALLGTWMQLPLDDPINVQARVIGTRAIRHLSEDVSAAQAIPERGTPPFAISSGLDSEIFVPIVDLNRAFAAILAGTEWKQSSGHSGGAGGNKRIRGVAFEEANARDVPGAKVSRLASGADYLNSASTGAASLPRTDDFADGPAERILATDGVLEPELDDDVGTTEQLRARVTTRMCRVPYSNDVLTPYQTATAIIRLIKLLEETEVAGFFILGLMLLHGVSVSRLKLRKGCESPVVSFHKGNLTIAIGLMGFHAPLEDSDWWEVTESVTDTLEIPLAEPLRRWLEKDGRRNEVVRRFREHPELETRLRSDFKTLALGGLASIGRLPFTFRNAIYRAGGDFAEVTFLTGEPDRALTWQPAYTCSESVALHKLVTTVHSEFGKWVSEIGPPVTIATSVAPEPHAVGSFRVPTAEWVRQYTQTMRVGLDASDSVFTEHNDLVVYLLAVLTVATGSRTTCMRFNRRTDFTIDFSYVWISDKDNDSYRGSRILKLPEKVVALLNKYEEHLSRYDAILRATHPVDIARTIDMRRGVNLQRDRSLEVKLRSHRPGFLYFGDEDLSPSVPTPISIQNFDNGRFLLSFYSLRHYVRVEALKAGMPSVTIDYGFGHWPELRSPYDKYSTIEMRAHAAEFSEFAAWLLERDGWI